MSGEARGWKSRLVGRHRLWRGDPEMGLVAPSAPSG